MEANIGGRAMRRLLSMALLVVLLASVGACRNPSMSGGTGSNGGGSGTLHTGIPF
jgi:hypothetical protein